MNVRHRLHVAFALMDFGLADSNVVDFIVSQVADARSDECMNFIAALQYAHGDAIAAMDSMSRTANSAEEWKHKARLAMLSLYLGSPNIAEEMCTPHEDSVQRDHFIRTGIEWHGDVSVLMEVVAQSKVTSLQSAFSILVGSIPDEDLQRGEQLRLATVLSRWHTDSQASGLHNATRWTLHKWKLMPDSDRDLTIVPNERREWYVNHQGMTMIRMPAGRIDDSDRSITVQLNAFHLADSEVTVAQFEEFIDHPYADKLGDWRKPTASRVNKDHPVELVSWYDAIMFCNWLSEQENLTPCYRRNGKQELNPSRKQKRDSWRMMVGANGYRVPTYAECEVAHV